MRNILFIFSMMLLVFSSCKKDTFFDKFVPEIYYYEGSTVGNPSYVSTTLPSGETTWTLKCRVSAPFKLKDIKLYKTVSGGSEQLLETYTEFGASLNQYNVNYPLTDITAETTIRIHATDMDGRTSSRTFLIKVTP